jgi:SRSO17 transposase
MTSEQVRSLGPALDTFLGELDDCFLTGQTRGHLREYVKGQLSDLPRKSVEPMAELAGVPARTLQEFLSLSDWDHGKARDRVQQIVARDHADPHAVGVVDESGHPKKGDKTACVQRQYCGNTGKIDNCVMTVHLAYAGDASGGGFRTMLDSDLYLPASWDGTGATARQRRRAAQVPDDVHYRPKYDIAPPCRNYRKARANGVTLAWVTADEWYGEKPAFVAGLEQMGQPFVLEIPRNLMGWSHEPADADEPRSRAQDLCRHSPAFTDQKWKRYHVKDTSKGPMVWEARAAPFWTLRDGRVVGPYRLMAARDVLDPDEVKYFLSDRVDVPVRVTLRVGLSRWPVERCLEDEKTELGLSHFECRKYPAVLRHLLVTQVSHLFLARQARRLRGEKRRGGNHDLPGPHRRRGAAGGLAPGRGGRPAATDRPRRGEDQPDADAERGRASESHQGPLPPAAGVGHPRRTPDLLPPAVTAIAL